MGGDLNLKKSWHTGLLSNQRKVYEAEQAALTERKKIEQVRREREEEFQIEETARLAEANGGPKRQRRVEFMYAGASAGPQGTTEDQEAFLLGKRRVDTILKREDQRALERAPVNDHDPIKEALEKAMAIEANIQSRKRKHEERHEYSKSARHRDHRSSRHRNRHRSTSRDRARHRSESPHRIRNRSRSGHRHEHHDRRRRRSHDRYHSPHYSTNQTRGSDENRAAKLAAMQADAGKLEADRSDRLAAMERRDAEEREREEKKRNRGVDFKSSLYRETEGIGLGDRLKNARRSQLSG